ncbi:MAG: hypothetical protein IT514_04905 [Burkholderiales bacterium]|nr:hypothetical protein [Burkholderiales bacterium]
MKRKRSLSMKGQVISRCYRLSAAALLGALLAGCGGLGVRYQGGSAISSGQVVAGGSYRGASISIGGDSRIVAGVVIAVMLAEGVRYYSRASDGSMTLLPRGSELDPARRISEQDCTRPIAIDGGNLKCR